MRILFLPNSDLTHSANAAIAAMRDSFSVGVAISFADVESLLGLQHSRGTYKYKACVIGRNSEHLTAEIERICLACPSVPVICLTHLKPIARIREKLLNVGAEDCLPVQHVTAGELQATILRRIASRGLSPKSSVVDVGDMTVNFSEQKACCGDLIGTFTALEWVLFKALAENAPGYVLYDDLEHIKSPHSDYEDRGIIPVIMYRIRRILKNIGASVEVECKDGIGYRLTSKIPKTN